MIELTLNSEYHVLLTDIKQRYKNAQLKAAYRVNRELIQFYWELGLDIVLTQAKTAWGSKFLEQLSHDLQADFPGTAGFSVRNLKFMRQFAECYPNLEFGKQAVSLLPWGHIILLMQQIKDSEARDWYAENALKNAISRSVLGLQIKQDLYGRQGKHAHKVTNFMERLPSPQSDLALQLFKDPYDLRFLPVTEDAKEIEIEKSMEKHLPQLFLELGGGFAYMGSQYKITVDGNDFFFDMLFYHVKLHSYIIVELKDKLKPEHVGKLNFYLSAADDVLRSPQDNPSIGLLLCQEKSNVIAEYSLRRTTGPIGIAEYQLMHSLPKDLSHELPSPKLIETKLAEKLQAEEKAKKE